jgi:hypothetical protein
MRRRFDHSDVDGAYYANVEAPVKRALTRARAGEASVTPSAAPAEAR